MAEQNAFGLPAGQPIASAWSRVIRNQKAALRKLLDNSRFANASIVSDPVTQAVRIWRQDFQLHADELTGRKGRFWVAERTTQGYYPDSYCIMAVRFKGYPDPLRVA